MSMPEVVDKTTRFLTGDVFRITFSCGDFSIKGHAKTQGNPRPSP
jgi:hypothetical protein